MIFWSLLFLTGYAVAQEDAPVAISTVFETLSNIIQNWKSFHGVAIAIPCLTLFIQLLKTKELGGILDKTGPNGVWTRRLFIFLLAQVCGVILSVSSGKFSLVQAVLDGLLTQGGAVALYEHLKPFFKKQTTIV